MKLTVVGCSGSFPGPDSAASCYLVEADETVETVDEGPGAGRTWRILLDLGSGALGPLQRYMSLYDVDAVLLSHLHADHCLDLTGLYVALKYRPPGTGAVGGSAPGSATTAPARVPVHGPSGVAARMSRAYDLPATGMDAEFDFREWRAGQPVGIGPFVVTPHAVEHPVEAYGLRVEADGAVLAFTGDTDSCAGLTPLCHDADVVLADSAFVTGRDEARGIHLTAARAAQAVLDAGGVGRLVLTHMPPWNDPEAARREAAAIWPGPLDVARPGATYALP